MSKKYDPAVKAAALAALLAGQSVTEVAKAYKLPRTTVIGWRNAAGVPQPTVSDTKKREFGELIAAYLEQNIRTLTSQVEYFRTVDWLKKQDASEVAILHGVLTDKAIRLLEALGGEPEESDRPDAG